MKLLNFQIAVVEFVIVSHYNGQKNSGVWGWSGAWYCARGQGIWYEKNLDFACLIYCPVTNLATGLTVQFIVDQVLFDLTESDQQQRLEEPSAK